MIEADVKVSTTAYDALPRFHHLERISPSAPGVEHVEDDIRGTLSRLNVSDEKLRGRTVGITVGSRGVASLKEITRAACQWLKDRGAHPFIFPAMGSHGGATAEGQRKILEDYGVTPEFVAAPVCSSMETVLLGETPEGLPVYVDRLAWQADAIMVMHRAKPHTTFSGTIESGLLKMMAVGMGKAEGAREFHRAARKSSYEKAIRAMATKVLAGGKILCGLAVIENEMHQICAVRAALPEGLVALDESCLAEARRLVPRLPFPEIDLLIVDEIGKNISRTGMDAKVIGRGFQFDPNVTPEIKLIYARDLTAESNGNALGIGLADFVHERLRRKIDFEKMYVNARTSMGHHLVRLPMVLGSDREALAFALEVLGRPEPLESRIAWIRNTQCLDRIAISERLALEALTPAGWRLAPRRFQPGFGPDGNLPSLRM
jgi:hypothetical protein